MQKSRDGHDVHKRIRIASPINLRIEQGSSESLNNLHRKGVGVRIPLLLIHLRSIQ
jgi:hypothetical protein